MNRGHHRWSLRAVLPCALCAGLAANASAAIIISTNQNGADAEVREDADTDMRPNTDPLWGPPGAPRGRNRGTSNELATRIKDATGNPTNDRTSAMYMKFDISGISQATLNANQQAALRLTIRNTNVNWSRIQALNPYYGSLPADTTNPEWVAFRDNVAANWTRIQFNVLGLKPEALPAGDPRRFGSADPNLPIPNYDWKEAPVGDPNNTATDETTWDAVKSPLIGPVGPISWYNAPGITPDSRTTPAQDTGKFNFNSDLELLGQVTLPNPPGLGAPIPDGGSRLPIGQPVDFTDPTGKLRALIQRAKNAGRTSVTIVVADALNGFLNATGETTQTTPGNMLNFNYLVNPKEKTMLDNDNNWDPDGAGPLTATGSPFSCDGSTGAGLTNCPGRTLGDNSNGQFSPQLILRVPEPCSVSLAVLGMLAAMTIRRRK